MSNERTFSVSCHVVYITRNVYLCDEFVKYARVYIMLNNYLRCHICKLFVPPGPYKKNYSIDAKKGCVR